jgi:hypothetical protein
MGQETTNMNTWMAVPTQLRKPDSEPVGQNKDRIR